jgi:hypothetical protein
MISMAGMALEIGNKSKQWVVFAQAFPFHEKDFVDVLFLELNKKLLTTFAKYSEADCLAWVVLFDYSTELITWFVVQIAVKNWLVSKPVYR